MESSMIRSAILSIMCLCISISANPIPVYQPSQNSSELAAELPSAPAPNSTIACNDTETPAVQCSEERRLEQDQIIVESFILYSAIQKVLRSYADQVYDQWDDVASPNCKPAVEYRSKITSTVTPKPSHLAKWYSTMKAQSSYLCHLLDLNATTTNGSAASVEEQTVAQLVTLRAVLTAVQGELFDLLEGLQCNCSDECRITEEDFDTLEDCTDSTVAVKSAVYYTMKVARETEDTLFEYLQTLDLTPELVPTFNKQQWIEEHLDDSLPAYCELNNDC